MDELVGGSAAEVRGGIAAEGDVSATEVFSEWGIGSGFGDCAGDLDLDLMLPRSLRCGRDDPALYWQDGLRQRLC